MPSFDKWFQAATGNKPFPYQRQFAKAGDLPQIVDVPTGLGKTAMAILGWLWRRRFAREETRKATPRRLVYCLPMRVLVEQTRDNAVLWLHNIEVLAGTAEFEEEKNGGKRLRSYRPDTTDSRGPNKVPVHILMGGEDEEDWDIHPEREQIIIGTQDMLLSRALNRGYAATRSRWPIQFGLLNTDCLWKKFHAGLLKYDPNSLIHGCFLEEIGGRLRATRILSGFIEGSEIAPAESGGVKNNIVQPELKGGEGNVPFHRTEFVAKEIKAYFNLDLALLGGYGLATEKENKQLDEWKKKDEKSRGERPFVFSNPEKLLIALSLLKVRRFLSTGLRLRTACDLEMDGELAVTRPNAFVISDEKALLEECKTLIEKCKSLFANPPITEVEWKPDNKKAKGKKGEGEEESGDKGTADDEDEDENK